MNDPVSTARAARENLARGLSALQGPGVPEALMDVAEPVAEAMSNLHHIESTHGAALTQAAPLALQSVRRALGMLQTQPEGTPAIDQAIEAIAGSLSLVHALNQMLSAQYAAAPGAQQAMGGTVVMGDGTAPYTQPSAQPGYVPQPWVPPGAQPAPYAQPQPQPGYAQPAAYAPAPVASPYAPPPAASPYAPPPAASPYGPPPQPAQNVYGGAQAWPVAPAVAGQPPWGQPQPMAQAAQGPAPQPPAPALGSAPQHPAPVEPYRAPPDAMRVEAELGAHSPSNFYKGLSGNDVIDSGGIFIATYKIPKIGQNVVIKVSLPGGYEFEALGTVEWTRDAPHSTAGSEIPPGFGAKFKQISAEGRQLVYRYVRNREPLFHDDL